MPRHGAEMHFVRPDAVYRTSVLQAIPGYQPVSNAHQVAARFTAAPYFATTLQGLNEALPLWDRIRFRVRAWMDRMQAKQAIRQSAAVAAMAQPVRAPASQAIAALPPIGPNSPQATNYGASPKETMMNAAYQITAQAASAGNSVAPPSVAEPEFDAAGRISPKYFAMPGRLAAMSQAGVPSFVADQAYRASMNKWNGVRQWWWWNLR